MKTYDLVILGSGSTAYAAARVARKLGKSVVLTEEGTFGGTCVNRGCMPSKFLIEASRVVHRAREPLFDGIGGQRPPVRWPRLLAQKDAMILENRSRKIEHVVDDGIDIEFGHAEFLDSHTIAMNGQRLSGEKILIATGSRPLVPEIAGLDRVPYWTSDLLESDNSEEITRLPSSLMIIGGGYVALELGQMFSRFGTKVTIVEQTNSLLSHQYEPEVGQVVRDFMESEGIRVICNATVRQLIRRGASVAAELQAGEFVQEIRAQRLLVATGRRANSDHIGVEKGGVDIADNGDIDVDSCLRTSSAHIFAAGDVIGSELHSAMATPVGVMDGKTAAHNALSTEYLDRVDHRIIPRTIFTDPEVATVGMTELEASDAGHHCWAGVVQMATVPRAVVSRQTAGFVKMVADRATDEILGVTMVGHNAGEVIHEAALALHLHARVSNIAELLHVHPSMAGALRLAARLRYV